MPRRGRKRAKIIAQKKREEVVKVAGTLIESITSPIRNVVVNANQQSAVRVADEAEIVAEETAIAGVRRLRVKSECRLDTYWLRAQILDRQYDAGMRLRRLLRTALLPQSVTSSYGFARGGGDGAGPRIDSRSTLRKVFLEAGLAVEHEQDQKLYITSSNSYVNPTRGNVTLTPMAEILVCVCGFDEFAGGSARLNELRKGLTLLADYWKLPSNL